MLKLKKYKVFGMSGTRGGGTATIIYDTRITPEGDTRVTPEGDTRVAPTT